MTSLRDQLDMLDTIAKLRKLPMEERRRKVENARAEVDPTGRLGKDFYESLYRLIRLEPAS